MTETKVSTPLPKVRNFSSLPNAVVLSDIFTVTHEEAYALMMVLNQLGNWRELTKPKEEGDKKAMKKLFTNPISGGRQSWNTVGQNIYHAVCREVEKLRADKEKGTAFQNDLLQYYKEKYGDKRKKVTEKEDPEEEGLFYDGDGLKYLLEEVDDDLKASV